MKANALIFVFLIFLIASGIWLLDGLTDAFGPERLNRQHSQAEAPRFARLDHWANATRQYL